MGRWLELRHLFDRVDLSINNGRGYSDYTNEEGLLAWGESYVMLAYVEMYRATNNRYYLRKLVEHFDRVLSNRDDQHGVVDVYSGKTLAGWGSRRYSGGKWHVWLVHTGMITMAPAEFVRLVRNRPLLKGEFGTKAQEYRQRIVECLRDTEMYWRTGPAPDEGYYFSPIFDNVLPLNQQNALGSVLVEMWRATNERLYQERAQRLARFFKNRLRTSDPHVYDWSYQPKLREDGKGSEDISHASLNADFAARCTAEGLVFSSEDAERFGNTWLRKVVRPDGTWADEVSGRGVPDQYSPGAGAMWLGLCRVVSKHTGQQIWHSVERALASKRSYSAIGLLVISRLLRYKHLAD